MTNRRTVLARPRRADRATLTTVEDGAIVTGLDGSPAVQLNPTALAIWELCDGDTHVDEMVEAVCALFAVSLDQARVDVHRLLTELHGVGAVT